MLLWSEGQLQWVAECNSALWLGNFILLTRYRVRWWMWGCNKEVPIPRVLPRG